jgi:hypothetical protein
MMASHCAELRRSVQTAANAPFYLALSFGMFFAEINGGTANGRHRPRAACQQLKRNRSWAY